MSVSTPHAPMARAAACDRKSRVLHVLPDLAIGGGQTIVLNHLRHHDDSRFQVLVAELEQGGELTPDVAAAIGRDPIDLAHLREHPWRSVPKLIDVIRGERVDLVHVHSDADRKIGHLAALRCGVPVVGHLHAEWIHLGPMKPDRPTLPRRARANFAGWARDRVEQRAVRHYVAESGRVRDLFRPLVEQPITVLDQAIPVDQFHGDRSRRDEVRSALQLDAGTPVLICVSRLVEGKGHGDLLTVLAHVHRRRPDAVLVLVGDGPERAPLEDLARQHGVADSVRFLGNRRDVPDLLDAADVFVFASENEGFGLAVLEGMAAALPVVAFRIPSLEEFVVPGATGVLVDGRDPSVFADGVLRYVATPQLANRHGAAGRMVVEDRFAPSRVARCFESVYDAVLDAPARRGMRSGGR